jgi:hypothetical protein
MADDMKRNIKHPDCAFRMFLKYSPDALEHLFDRFKLNLLGLIAEYSDA